MSDRLKDFIDDNRKAFDDKEPSENIWKNIDAALFGSRAKVSWYNSLALWRAAAVLFLALSIYLMIPKQTNPSTQVVAENENVLKEFSDVESFYVKQISEKVALIDGFESDGLNGFTKDFQQLEAMYNVLREEMKTRPSQKVKDALVLNLLVQIDLLNQHLHKLEKESQHEDTDKSKANI